MIRSRYSHFLHLKGNHHRGGYREKDYASLADQPVWFEEYYSLKDTLKEIQNNSNSLYMQRIILNC